MSFWGIIRPEAGTNLILNPSAETTGNFGAHNGATVTRDPGAARFGDYGYLVTTGGSANRGMTFTVGALANADHYFSIYVSAAPTTMQVSTDGGSNYNAVTVLNVGPLWRRVGVLIPAAQANGSVTLILRNTGTSSFYADGALLQALGYLTTYFDGDTSPYCKWSGLRHASTSSRSVQERLGGRELDLYDDFGIGVRRNFAGAGMPPVYNSRQSIGGQPGAAFQGYRVGARGMALTLDIEGSTWEDLHAKRQDLIDLVKPDRVVGAQPFIIVYKGANASSPRKLYAAFRYEGGLGLGGVSGFAEDPSLQVVADDPYWYDDDRETAVLDFTDSITTAAYGLVRKDGDWQGLGSGFNGTVWATAVDQERGRVYFGGEFTTANGVTVNGICYWNGTTFVAMGATPGVSGGAADVYAIAIAPNGDVYVGGDFSAAGGATSDSLARWNVASSTWTAFTGGTGGGSDKIYALAFDENGLLYVGGSFVNWDGNADSDNIFVYDGAASDNLSTGANGPVLALAVHPDGKVYAGGTFTTIGGVSATRGAYWDGSTFVALSSGFNGNVASIAVAPDGDVYFSGNFTTAGGETVNYVARWNGTSFSALAGGADALVQRIVFAADGTLYASGSFTTIGGVSIVDRFAGWNGYTWFALDVNLPGTPTVYAMSFLGEDFFIGFSTTGTATASGQTTVTPSATAEVYPDFSVIGPSSATATLQWLENQTTGELLLFDLVVNTLETILISLQPWNKSVATIWSGRPGARPGGSGLKPPRGGPYNGPIRSVPGQASILLPGGNRFAGVIADQPLRGSDFAAFHLLPGANVVAAFLTGTTTGAVIAAHWVPRHWSVDAAAP